MSGFIVELWNLKFENSIMDIKSVAYENKYFSPLFTIISLNILFIDKSKRQKCFVKLFNFIIIFH